MKLRILIFTSFMSIFAMFTSASAKVNITEQYIVDDKIQNECDQKHDNHQDILSCIASKYQVSEKFKIKNKKTKIYEVDFSGFGTGLVLTPKGSDKNIIIEIDGHYLYASSIFNIKTCCNTKAPFLILERVKTVNRLLEDCSPCSSHSELWVYELNNLNRKPLLIDMGYNYTNSSVFGALVSNDIGYDWESLTWSDKTLSFMVDAHIPGPPGDRAKIRIGLEFYNKEWQTRLYAE